MKEIDTKKLQSSIDENLKLLFKPYIDGCIKTYGNSNYYHFLDEELYSFLDKYFEEVDSMAWESLECLKDKLGQYVYIAHYGEPFSKEELIELKEKGNFDDNAFSFNYLENLKDLTHWRSDEIDGYEPIKHGDIEELVIVKSYLEVYNNLK